MSVVLGVDPGTGTTGYGLVREQENTIEYLTAGVVDTPSEMDHPDRLAAIYQSIQSITDEFEPDVARVEEIFFNRNVKTAIEVGEARGVILLALNHYGGQQGDFDLGEYNPSTIKKVLTGKGNADKHTVQQVVKQELNLSGVPSPNDAADALAAALTYCLEERFQENIEYQ